MNISTLCDKIGLRADAKGRVVSFSENFDFRTVDELQKGYRKYSDMMDTLEQVRAVLGEDADGMKILACMLRAVLDAYEVYRDKGISDEIFFATMRCFPRFMDETCRMTGGVCFDRYWWTTRQAGCHLFRIGELEYEMKHTDQGVVIGVHIPSDADFSPAAVDRSLCGAREFFAKFYPELRDAEYRCHSWLLDGQLKEMLGEQSNIINFQNRFEIFDEGEEGTECVEWVFNTKSTDYSALPEMTSLQRNMKKHLLTGGVIRSAYGRMKKMC